MQETGLVLSSLVHTLIRCSWCWFGAEIVAYLRTSLTSSLVRVMWFWWWGVYCLGLIGSPIPSAIRVDAEGFAALSVYRALVVVVGLSDLRWRFVWVTFARCAAVLAACMVFELYSNSVLAGAVDGLHEL
ncbi:hypothetical protein U1Q18_037389 [Sarracenia purpurea var. burkii]